MKEREREGERMNDNDRKRAENARRIIKKR